jgi:hypothetical protein
MSSLHTYFDGFTKVARVVAFSFWWYWGLNSGPQVCLEVLYHLSHSPSQCIGLEGKGGCVIARKNLYE